MLMLSSANLETALLSHKIKDSSGMMHRFTETRQRRFCLFFFLETRMNRAAPYLLVSTIEMDAVVES